jgi:predicted anti-sigma-YlaC factor YlaD
MLCKDIVENIMGYIEAQLDYKTLVELEKHLDMCPECTAFIRTYKRMLSLTGRLREKSFVTPEVRSRLKELLLSKIKSQ